VRLGGWLPEPDFPANRLHISRKSIEKNVVFLDR
jgi:hypothetical protein